MKFTPFYFALFCFFYTGYDVLEHDYKYIEAIKGEMKLNLVPATYENARLFCNLQGGRLASPENTHMVEAMKQVMKNLKRSSPVLTGVTSLIGDVFITEHGTHLSELPVKWAKGEPNNYLNDEKCLVMDINGKVADKRCNNDYPYICFRYTKRQNAQVNKKSLGVCGGETLQTAGYAKWGPGEPNNGGVDIKLKAVETCGIFMRPGYLNDISCLVPAPFICERKKGL